jgi:hypothetical protein
VVFSKRNKDKNISNGTVVYLSFNPSWGPDFWKLRTKIISREKRELDLASESTKQKMKANSFCKQLAFE